MLKKLVPAVVATILFTACSPNKPSPLFLTILLPRDGDTAKTQANNPVEGKTCTGAKVSVGFAQNSPNNATLVPDDTGRFAGAYTIPTNETADYSVYITASFEGKSITETRTVHYIQH
jgi:hypothetical protein